MKFLNPIDLNKLEIQNSVIQNLGTAPSAPVEGQQYFDTVSKKMLIWNATASAWQHKATDSDLLQGSNSAYHLSRANHSGTQLAATISDFDTQVRLSRLDQMAVPTGSVAFGSQKITGLADGVASSDAATVGQVNAAAAGIDNKQSCRFLTTANITLSGLGTGAGRDWGSSLTSGDRILVANQSTASENGIYTAAAGAWTRAIDCDSAIEYTPQAFTYIEESASTYAGSQTADANGGLSLTGSAYSVKLPASSGLVTDSTGTYIDTAIVNRKYAETIGDGSTTSFVITHNLNTQDVQASFRYVASTYAFVEVDYYATSVNTITVVFAVAPTTNQIRVIVTG